MSVQHRTAMAALIFGAAAIGLAPIWIRYSMLGAPAIVFYRLVIAFPFFALVALMEYRNEPAGKETDTGRFNWLWLFFPGILFAADTLLWTLGINYTTVANAALLGNIAPVFVTLVAWQFFGERFNKWFPVGLVLALAGSALLTGSSFQLDIRHVYGDALAAVSALFYAGYQLGINRVRRNRSTALLMACGCVSGAVLCAVVMLFTGEPWLPPVEAGFRGWWPLFGIAIVSHFLGQGSIAYAFAHLPASFSSVTLLIQPIVATVAAWVLLGESLGLLALVGGVTVMAGIVLARKGTSSGGAPHEHQER